MTDETITSMMYDGATDTIPNQKTLNIDSIYPKSTMDKSTFSFWFLPSAYSNLAARRARRVLQVSSKKDVSYSTFQKIQYTVKTLANPNQAVQDKAIFNTYLQNYETNLVFLVVAKNTATDSAEEILGVSYRNTGSYYAFVIKSDLISFEYQLEIPVKPLKKIP